MGNLLPDIKKQIGWVGSALDIIIQAAMQFFEELKTTALAFQVASLQEQKSSFRSSSKLTQSFYQSPGRRTPSTRNQLQGGTENTSADCISFCWRLQGKQPWMGCFTYMEKRPSKMHSDGGDWPPRPAGPPGTWHRAADL